MVFLQFLVGHLVKLRWRLSTPHQLKWSGVHRCPPSSTVRSEGTRCTMSGWLMGSPQDSQSSRTSWLMMPRYNTPSQQGTSSFRHIESLSPSPLKGFNTVFYSVEKDLLICDWLQFNCVHIFVYIHMSIATYAISTNLFGGFRKTAISVCTWPYLLSLFFPYSDIIISGNMMIQLIMWVAKLDQKNWILLSPTVILCMNGMLCTSSAIVVYSLIFTNGLRSCLMFSLKTADGSFG